MKLCFKSFVSGIIVASIGTATVFAAGAIQSASYNSSNVTFNGKTIDLSAQPMVSITKDGETNPSNYIPVRGVLEAMGYDVSWNNDTKTVNIITHGIADTTTVATPVIEPTATTTEVTTPANTEINEQFSIVGKWRGESEISVQTLDFKEDGTVVFIEDVMENGKKINVEIHGKYSYAQNKLIIKVTTLISEGEIIEITEEEALVDTALIHITNNGNSFERDGADMVFHRVK